MIGLDNPLHIIMLMGVLLLVFGARRLPEMGRSLGAGLRGFKQELSGDPLGRELGGETAGRELAAAPLALDELPQHLPAVGGHGRAVGE